MSPLAPPAADRLSQTCVVIPTYKEADNIARLLEELRLLSTGLKVVVVDDASPDGTADRVEELARARPGSVSLIRRASKLGRGSACLEGFSFALALGNVECVVEMDADFSHDPSELPGMISALSSSDWVVRSRYQGLSRIVAWGVLRRIFSRLANLLARMLLRVPITDYTNGYRAYTRRALTALEPQGIDSHGYIVLSEVACQLWAKGFKPAELPSLFINRRRGESNLTPFEILGAAWGLLRLRLRMSRKSWPSHGASRRHSA